MAADIVSDVVRDERDYVMQTYTRAPFVLDRGEGVRLFDTAGQSYIDLASGLGVNALGHGNRRVLAALVDQLERLVHASPLFHTVPHVELAKRLVQGSFGDKVFFSNSGTEANEAAIKFARAWARREFDPSKTTVVAFTGGFHGRTFGSLAITDRPDYQAPFTPLMPGAVIARLNDLESAQQAINSETCAVFVEPIQGEGGVREALPEFLEELRALCDKRHALLVFDEVQCGMGRTGSLWAYQATDVAPDIMCLGKPLGFGFPIGATVVRQFVADAIRPWEHANTFGANPAICRAACEVFDIISAPAFLREVRRKGDYLADCLRRMGSSRIVDVRGRGLMVGVEIDGSAREAVDLGYRRGVIMATAGPNVIRLLPPLVIEDDDLNGFVNAFAGILADL